MGGGGVSWQGGGRLPIQLYGQILCPWTRPWGPDSGCASLAGTDRRSAEGFPVLGKGAGWPALLSWCWVGLRSKAHKKTSTDLMEFPSVRHPGLVINRKLTIALLLFTYWFRAGLNLHNALWLCAQGICIVTYWCLMNSEKIDFPQSKLRNAL